MRPFARRIRMPHDLATVRSPNAPLVAYRDRTVSRIRAKYENRLTYRYDANALAALRAEIVAAGRRRFKAGKWLERSDVERVETLFQKAYDEAPFLLDARDEERPGTRFKPRSWAVYRSRLNAVAGDDRLVRLHAAMLVANRKHVEHVVLRTTHCWTYHAQERLHERTPDWVRADREIALGLLDQVGMLQVVCNPFDDRPARMAIPCGEGLLCGVLGPVPNDHVCATGTTTDSVATTFVSDTFEDMLLRSVEAGEPYGAYAFTGITYIGPDEMRASQFEYRDRMARVGVAFKPLSEALTANYVGHSLEYRVLNPDGTSKRLEDFEQLCERLMPGEDILRELRALFADRSMKGAVGENALSFSMEAVHAS